MRQLAVAHQKAQAARIQISLARAGYAIVDGGDSDNVIGPMPAPSLQRQARSQRAVDVREFVRLDVAARLAGANKRAQILSDLLLQIQACADASAVSPN